jgi:hypothetical protein
MFRGKRSDDYSIVSNRIPAHGWCAPDEPPVLAFKIINASTTAHDKKPCHRWYPQEPKYKYVAMTKLTVARWEQNSLKEK